MRLLHIAFITLCIWIAFGKGIHHDFVWDDHILIVDNSQIKQISSIDDFFSRSFWYIDEDTQDKARNFYRPLIMASYAVDYVRHGLNPKGFHFTNILAHMLCAIVVYLLAAKLLKNQTQAFIAALIWAVHPTHVENVVWISGRTDIFAGIFYLLSFYFFLIWLISVKRPWLSLTATCVCYALSLHCKEMAITLPILFGVVYFLTEDKKCSLNSLKGMFVTMAFITVGYLTVRHVVLGSIASSTLNHAWGDILLSMPLVFTRYIGLVLGLVPIDPHHAETVLKSAWSISFALYAMVVLAYAAVLGMVLRRRQNILLFCLLWFPVTLMPVFVLGKFGDILYADRFLYIPSVGLICAAVTVVYRLVKRKGKMVRAAALLLGALYLLMNISYSRTVSAYWKDDLSLFSQAVQTSPDSPYIHFNLGNILSHSESYEKAVDEYNKAIALFPRYIEAYNNKAFVLNRMERYEEAMVCSKRALSSKDVHFSTFNNMGDSLMGLGDIEGAEKCYIGSLALKKTAIGHHQFALCLMEQGKINEAYAHFMEALSIKMNPRILNNVGGLFLEQGNPDKALVYAKRALSRLKPNMPSNIKLEIHYNMARAFLEKGAFDQADRHMKNADVLISLGYGAPSVREKIIKWLETKEKTIQYNPDKLEKCLK